MATKEATKNDVSEAVESLESAAQEVYIEIGEGDDRIVFVQKPLTFFGKIEFFSIVGKALDRMLSDGTSLSDILEAPEVDGGLPLSSNVRDADVFVKAIAKIVTNAPELLKDVYLVALNVPRGQRDYVALRLEELTDEQGVQILNTFVDQNWEVMVDFFQGQMVPLFNKVVQKVQA